MFRYDSQKKCTVLYDLNHEVFEVDMLPYAFLDLMCLHHGSSMQGRIDAFKSMLKDKDIFAQKGKNAVKLADIYSWDEIAKKSHEVYCSIVDKRGET
jgi:hypothetical protein